MYVRWQLRAERKRKIDRWYRWHEVAWQYASLVESVRIDGKPTQRHVAYLGSVHFHARKGIHYRSWWWHDMSAKLDRLGNRISPDDRRKIEAALAKEVMPVTAKQVTEYDLQQQKKIRAEHGECRGCYLDWPPGQAGVPPRPKFPEARERFANTIATVMAVEAKRRG
jgi:hypothetical protein